MLNTLMCWDRRHRRWWKYKSGHKRFVVSCRQLAGWSGEPVPETKEGSYLVANRWWQAKLAEIEAQQPPHPYARILAQLERRRDWARRHGTNGETDTLAEEIETLKSTQRGDLGHGDSIVRDMFLGSATTQDIWQDRLERDRPEPVSDDRTLAGQLRRWYEGLDIKVQAGDMTPSRLDNIKAALAHFESHVGKETLAERIDGDTIEGYYKHLLGQVGRRRKNSEEGISAEYAKTIFGMARQFVRWLWSREVITLPRNIDSRGFRFKASPKAIVTFTDEEVVKLVEGATGQLKLHILLMLNCGYKSTDIAELKRHQVDWKEGRIIRRRSKTEDQVDVPIVNYKLWPQTFELLMKHDSGQATVLLTRSGGLWAWEERGDDGKTHSSDNIASNFNRLRDKLGVGKSLDKLRKTSATKIESHREYGRYKIHFLGHSPRTLADKHYAAPSRDLFDEVLAWVGKQYGSVITG